MKRLRFRVDNVMVRYSCDRYQEGRRITFFFKKERERLTFKIEEKIGLLFQICASQNFQ